MLWEGLRCFGELLGLFGGVGRLLESVRVVIGRSWELHGGFLAASWALLYAFMALLGSSWGPPGNSLCRHSAERRCSANPGKPQEHQRVCL